MEQLMFWLCGSLAVVFSLMMILKRNPIHSALCLVVVFVSLAMLYVLLGAEFLAAVQVIVYAGAIMVLFLFVIMLLNLNQEVRSQGAPRIGLKACSLVGAGLVLLLLITAGVFRTVGAAGQQALAPAGTGNTRALAELLFTKYLLPFEVTSVLLLAAIVGAIVLAGKKE
jgi:NADH-quinone oxidoreductase subunit J